MRILRYILASLIFIFYNSIAFGQNKQKEMMESYIGKWCGNLIIHNINRSGGWSSPGGFLGFHEISKEKWDLYLNVKFLHPMDDPEMLNEMEKMGYPIEYVKGLRNLIIVPDELKIRGHAILSGHGTYSHETKEYCQECTGDDYSIEKTFPGINIPVYGRVDLAENKIRFSFDFDNVPDRNPLGLSGRAGRINPGYNLGPGIKPESINLVKANVIEIKYEYFEGPAEGEGSVDQKVTGELYRIYTRKDILGETVHINELIKTDKFTRRDIVIPNVGEVIVNTNSECIFKEDKLLEQTWGEIEAKFEQLPKDYNFKVGTPQAVSSVRGTQFITKVDKDGTTTVTVLDGEVEFSDKQMRKNVVLKENQRSTVKPGGLPSVPVSINPKQLLKWWE